MIKAWARVGTDGHLVFLGLSAGNVTLLQEGRPLVARLDELGIPGLDNIQIVIHYGETEASILAELTTYGVQLRLNT